MDGIVLAPGTMRISTAQPNPHAAAGSQLYLFSGEATSVPIQNIEFTAGGALLPSPAFLDSRNFHLKIFHFNDLHGHLMRFTSAGEESILSRIVGKIKSERQKLQDKTDSAVLVFSAGDDCTGSIFDEILNETGHGNPVHPSYRLYSKMGVDAAGLGNHDLDRGVPFLADSVQHNAFFPVLAANLKGCPSLAGFCHPAALLVVKGVRIGLIGLVTRAETHLDPEICQIVDPIPVAQNLVTALRPLCDVLIIISHLGYNLDSPVPMADAGDVELAHSLPTGSVDLIIGGHSHTPLNANGLAPENIVNGIPIVQTGACGEFLGQVDLQLQPNSVKINAVSLLPTQSLPSDAAFEAELQPFNAQVRELWQKPVGQVEDHPDLNTQVIVTDFARRELAFANFVSEALVERMQSRGFPVDFAMIDASALKCGLPYGDHLTYGDCFEVMPYADTLRVYTLTGRQVQDLLVDNARRVDQPGEPDLERGFLQFSQQVRYTLDPTKGSVLDLTVDGTPVVELYEKIFNIVTSSFIRRLAEPWVAQWPVQKTAQLFEINQYAFIDTDFLLRSEIVTYIQKHGGVMRQTGFRCDGRLKIIERE